MLHQQTLNYDDCETFISYHPDTNQQGHRQEESDSLTYQFFSDKNFTSDIPCVGNRVIIDLLFLVIEDPKEILDHNCTIN